VFTPIPGYGIVAAEAAVAAAMIVALNRQRRFDVIELLENCLTSPAMAV
jgi:hypothetical protein